MRKIVKNGIVGVLVSTCMLFAVIPPVNASAYSDTESIYSSVDEVENDSEQLEVLSIEGFSFSDLPGINPCCQYTGKAIKPSIEVYDKYNNVIPESEYSIEYKDNIKVGKATITVTGTGEKYVGSISKEFSIFPKKPSIKSIKPGKKNVKITWSKVVGAEKYEVYIDTKKQFVKGKKYTVTKGKTSLTIKNLQAKKKYYIKIRAIGCKDTVSLFTANKTFKTK